MLCGWEAEPPTSSPKTSPGTGTGAPLSPTPNLLQQACKHLLGQREAARSNLEDYRQYIATSEHLDFVYPPAQHHRVIQEHLEALIDDEIRRLMIFCPPGAAKSTYSSVQAATQFMAKNPTKNILACSNTQDLAEAFNKRRRAVVETEEWQSLSGTSLDPNNKGAKEFGLQAGGLSIAAGAESSITGKRSHFNIADDLIIGHEQANSPTQLDKLWQWWSSDFRSRLVPRSPELVIMTRWSSGDPAGRLLDSNEADTWQVLRLPMECDSADDPLGREIGERLWPEWFEPERVEEFKRNPRDWISLFQQRPTDEKGVWCPEENIQITSEVPDWKTLNIVVGCDIALSIQGGDWTVFAVVGVDKDRNMWLLDLYRAQVGPETSAKKFIELCQQYTPSRAMVDDDNASKVWYRYVIDMARDMGYPPPLQLRPMRGNDKEVRAAALRGYLMNERFYIKESPWSPDVYKELFSFPSMTVNDDIVDALALVAREMVSTSAPSAVKPQEPVELKSALKVIDGKQHLTKTLDEMYADAMSMSGNVRSLYQ